MRWLLVIHFWVIGTCVIVVQMFFDCTTKLDCSYYWVNPNSKNSCLHPNSNRYLGFPVHTQKETNKELAVLEYFFSFDPGPKDKTTLIFSLLHLHYQIYGRFSFVLLNSKMTNKESKYRKKVAATNLCSTSNISGPMFVSIGNHNTNMKHRIILTARSLSDQYSPFSQWLIQYCQ